MLQNPLSLDRYIYAAQDPVNLIDPTGHFFAGLLDTVSAAISNAIDEAIDLYDSAVEYKSLVNVAQGLSDLFLLGSFGLAIRSAIADGIPSVGIRVASVDVISTGNLLKLEGRLYYAYAGKGIAKSPLSIPGDLLFQIAADIKNYGKVRLTLDLTDYSKSTLQGGFNFPLVNVTAARTQSDHAGNSSSSSE